MSTIDDIKQRIDIVEVVSQSVPNLQKAGRNFRALCPFHAEKDPSFYVFPERQSWYCFGGCHGGGDIFSFVMRKDNLTFSEALNLLAARAGVPLATADKVEDKQAQGLYSLNEAASHFYHRQLLEAAEASLARDYLKQRGLSMESVLGFGLGYSPAQGQALLNHLVRQGWKEEEIIQGGLAIRTDRGEGRDLFHRRLIFPIKNIQGKVAGFGGRALDDASPKYLNSPATLVFSKNSLLYGLHEAREAIRQAGQVVLVEGYMDVVIAHQYGFKNVIATMGTALTENQFLSLKRFSRNLIFALDADPAGLHATLRGFETAAKSLGNKVQPIPNWKGLINYENVLDAEIKVLLLPSGRDPDEVILQDPQAWSRLCAEAVPVMDFLLDSLTRERDLSQIKEKREVMRQLQPFFHQIKEPIRWSHYVQKLSRRLKVEERLLASALKPGHRVGPKDISTLPTPSYLEEYCLSLLFSHPELKAQCPEETIAYLTESRNQELFRAWWEAEYLSAWSQALDPYLQEHLTALLSRRLPPLKETDREVALSHYLLRLKENFLRQQLKLQEEALASPEGKAPAYPGLEEQLKQVLLQQANRGE